ncbi:MFS transporter [Pararobbsia alpina]|uniref:MFS transporter n=1 Tax=Pararobbsia alpina TaxID=621374 RepID=UPI0039A6A1F2
MSNAPTLIRGSGSLVAGAIAAQIVGGLSAQMSPFTVAGLIDGFALSERDAGLIASAELVALAATAIAFAPVLPKYSARRVSFAALAVTLVAQSLSVVTTSLAHLVVLRVVAGVGEGALYAVSLAVVASHCANPDKVYGYFQLVWALGSVALFSGGGELTSAYAHRGVFALMVAVSAMLTPLLCRVPGDRTRSGPTEVDAGSRNASIAGVMTMLGIALYLTASAAIYAFSAPLGERAGIGTRAVGYALTAATIAGLAGAGGATALNIRRGRALPISGFMICFVLTVIALCCSRNPTLYVIALIASAVIYYFSLPYVFGLAAALDRSGRWAAAAGSAFLIGFAVGPLFAGIVISAAGYVAFAAVCVVISVVAWVLLLGASRLAAEPC